MKKGDEYRGKESGLRLRIKDTSVKSITVEVERRVVDRRTAEIRLETRERVVPKELVDSLLLGYERA